MNINIKITEGCGIVVNRNELSLREANLKDQLYGAPVQPPERDRPSQPKPPLQSKQSSGTTAKKPPKRQSEQRKVDQQEVRQFEREMNNNIKEFSKNQASLGMLHTNNQIIKTQQEILTEQQNAIKQLQRKKSEEAEPRRPAQDSKEPQQVLREMTSGLNRQLDEIRRLRDDIMRTAKEFSQTVSKAKSGEAPTALPNNLVEMNKNLKAMVQTSQQNIDLISPEKLELLGKLQNFNLEGYTQHLNGLKAQIAMVHKQSEQVEKELKQRLAKLEKLTITPKFDEQLAQPYEQNIKKQLQTIDLQQARRSVLEKLGGDFDYVGFDAELSSIAAQAKQEMSDFQFTIQKYRIDVPELRLDAKELKALDIKLPSILEEYKAARGIVIQPPVPAPSMGRTGDVGRGTMGRTGGSQPRGTGEIKQTGTGFRPQQTAQGKGKPARQRSIEQLVTKPKDLATSVKYKNLSEDEPFNTVLNQKTSEQQRKQTQKRTQKQQLVQAKDQPKKKTREEEDFEKYLQARQHEELEQLYKERRDRLAKMKNQLYEEANSQPMIQLTVDHRNRIELERPGEDRKQSVERKQPPKRQEQYTEQLGEPGRRLVDTTEGMVIKEIGKQVLLEKIKSIFQVDRPERREPEARPAQTVPEAGNGVNAVAGFAEGFLSVINSTLSAMNRGLSTGIQQKLREREQRNPQSQSQQRRVPLPALQQIPKPPVFNLKFDRNIRPAASQPLRNEAGGYPTFSNNFNPVAVPQAGVKNYSHLDVSDVSSYSQIDLDRQQIKSHMSGISNTSNLDISRSGNLTKSRQ